MTNPVFEDTTRSPDFVRVDSRGRVNVSRFAEASSNLLMHQERDGTIVLRRAVVLTAKEYEALGRQHVESTDTPSASEPAAAPAVAA